MSHMIFNRNSFQNLHLQKKLCEVDNHDPIITASSEYEQVPSHITQYTTPNRSSIHSSSAKSANKHHPFDNTGLTNVHSKKILL